MRLPRVRRGLTAPRWGLFFAVLLLGTLPIGCTSSRTAQQVDEWTRALGTWTYQSSATSALQRGQLQIMTRDGDLVARFQDQWRGQFEAQIRLQGNRMVIAFDHLRIQGQITNGRFSGVVRKSRWDVTRQTARQRTTARFEARRVEVQPSGDGERFGCPSLLREGSYACSPLPPR